MARLTLAERLWRYAEITRIGFLLYRAENPLAVQLTTRVPRVLLQGVFFVLLGQMLGGTPGAVFSFVGILGYTAAGSSIVEICDVPMEDHWSGTYYRLQAGAASPAAVYLLRSLPYMATGMVSAVLVLCIDGPLLGLGRSAAGLLPALPLYLLTAVTSAMFGLAVAALATGGSNDVLLGNLAAYVVLAASGIVAPARAGLHWLAYLGDVLPLSHGVDAVRAAAADRPWAGEAAREAAVGAAWLAVALLLIHRQDRAARGQRLTDGLRRRVSHRPGDTGTEPVTSTRQRRRSRADGRP
jgi:ABC-2 type transport system permease protein